MGVILRQMLTPIVILREAKLLPDTLVETVKMDLEIHLANADIEVEHSDELPLHCVEV